MTSQRTATAALLILALVALYAVLAVYGITPAAEWSAIGKS